MEQRANFVTLAVEDVDRSRAFYVDGLGWQPVFEAPGEVLFLPVGHGLVLSLWSRAGFTAEVGEPSTGLAPITLAHNVLSPAEVDEVLAGAAAAGAPVTPGEQREWGGYSGYFADPDGYRWEVAHDPSPLGDDLVTQSRRWLAARTPSPVAGVAPAVQDHYPEDAAHCYGCGARNPQGHQLKTRWAGESRPRRSPASSPAPSRLPCRATSTAGSSPRSSTAPAPDRPRSRRPTPRGVTSRPRVPCGSSPGPSRSATCGRPRWGGARGHRADRGAQGAQGHRLAHRGGRRLGRRRGARRRAAAARRDARMRDRDDAGRARQARPRDALGRPLPYGAKGSNR